MPNQSSTTGARLPLLITRFGRTANPFGDIAATGHRQIARLLAVAVVAAHDTDQIFAVLRGFARAGGEPSGALTGWLTGSHLTAPAGDTIDRGVLDLYARIYLGESLDCGAVQWLTTNCPHLIAIAVSE